MGACSQTSTGGGSSTEYYYYGVYFDNTISTTKSLGMSEYTWTGDFDIGTSATRTSNYDTYLYNTWAVSLGSDTYYTKKTNYQSSDGTWFYAFQFSAVKPAAGYIGGPYSLSIPSDALYPFGGGTANNHAFQWYIDGSNVHTGGSSYVYTFCSTSTSGYRHTVYVDDFAGHYGTSGTTVVCTSSSAGSTSCCSGTQTTCGICASGGTSGSNLRVNCATTRSDSGCFIAIEGTNCLNPMGTKCVSVVGHTC